MRRENAFKSSYLGGFFLFELLFSFLVNFLRSHFLPCRASARFSPIYRIEMEFTESDGCFFIVATDLNSLFGSLLRRCYMARLRLNKFTTGRQPPGSHPLCTGVSGAPIKRPDGRVAKEQDTEQEKMLLCHSITWSMEREISQPKDFSASGRLSNCKQLPRIFTTADCALNGLTLPNPRTQMDRLTFFSNFTTFILLGFTGSRRIVNRF